MRRKYVNHTFPPHDRTRSKAEIVSNQTRSQVFHKKAKNMRKLLEIIHVIIYNNMRIKLPWLSR